MSNYVGEVSKFSLVFAPMHNTKGRHDASEFQRQAKAFMRHHGLPSNRLVIIDNSKPKAKMRAEVLEAIRNVSGYDPVSVHDCVAFHCHGYKRGIQLGFDVGHVDVLAKALRKAYDDDIVVPLYACDTGRDLDRDRLDDLEEFGGDGGFADELRDALCRTGAIGCRVDAHTTAGHLNRNPNVRRFNGDHSPTGGHGGFYIVPKPTRKKKGSAEMWRKWRAALKTPFRFDFPFMETADIHAYLKRKR